MGIEPSELFVNCSIEIKEEQSREINRNTKICMEGVYLGV